MADSLQGISALDPRVAATDKFIQEKKIPPDQVEDFLLSMGADPRLASLVFKYRKVREAAETQQKQPPSTSNVADEISNQYAQLKQQERMRQGVAAMPAPNLARAPMRGGITGQPAPQAQMAGGGIVAFANGGRPPRTFTVDPEGNVDIGSVGDLIPYEAPVEPDTPRKASLLRRIARNPLLRRAGYAGLGLTALSAFLGDDEEEKKKEEPKVEQLGLTDAQRRMLAERDAAAGPVQSDFAMPGAPKFRGADFSQYETAIKEAEKNVPANRKAAYEEEMQRLKDIGAFEGIEARRKTLKEQKEKATMSPDKRFWLSFAQAGFAASAKGARNLWETLSMGGAEGMKAYQAMKDKEAETLERIADKELQLQDMMVARKTGAMERGDKRFDDTRKELRDLRLQYSEQKNINNRAASQFEANIYGTQVQASIAKMSREQKAAFEGLQRQYQRDVTAAMSTQDPQMRAALEARSKETLQALGNLAKTDPSVIGRLLEQELENQIVRKNKQGSSSGGETYLGSM